MKMYSEGRTQAAIGKFCENVRVISSSFLKFLLSPTLELYFDDYSSGSDDPATRLRVCSIRHGIYPS